MTTRPAKKLLIGVLVLTLGLALCWWALNRLLAPCAELEVLVLPGIVASGGSRSGPSPEDRFKVVAFNIAHGRGLADSNWGIDDPEEALSALGDFLRGQDADLVVLNEVDFASPWTGYVDQAAALAAKAGYEVVVELRNVDLAIPGVHWRFGNAILSRHPIRRCRTITFPRFSALEWVIFGPMRQGVVCTVSAPFGEVLVVALHLDHRDPDVQVASAALVAEVVGGWKGLVVVAGDFNSALPGFPEPRMDDAGVTALSVLLEGGKLQAPLTAPPAVRDFTYPTFAPDRVIDWILVSRGFRIERYEVVPVALSDHLPVAATLRVEAER